MRSMGLISNLTDPGKSENVLVFARMLSLGTAPFEFLKMHLYQYTQKIEPPSASPSFPDSRLPAFR